MLVGGTGGMEKDNKQPYPLPCPVCGTSMVGEKSDEESEDFDLHRCLSCGSVVALAGDPDLDEP